MDDIFLYFVAETNRFLAAANYTAAILLTYLTFYMANLIFVRGFFDNKKTSIKQMMIGVFFESAGWALHRWWYALTNHVEKTIRDMDIIRISAPEKFNKLWYDVLYNIDAFANTHTYVAIIPMVFIITGLCLMLSPLLAPYLDRCGENAQRTFFITFGLIFGIYWFIFWSL